MNNATHSSATESAAGHSLLCFYFGLYYRFLPVVTTSVAVILFAASGQTREQRCIISHYRPRWPAPGGWCAVEEWHGFALNVEFLDGVRVGRLEPLVKTRLKSYHRRLVRVLGGKSRAVYLSNLTVFMAVVRTGAIAPAKPLTMWSAGPSVEPVRYNLLSRYPMLRVGSGGFFHPPTLSV